MQQGVEEVKQAFNRAALLALVSMLVVGCGGGGGGSAEPPPTPVATRDQALSLGNANASEASALAMGLGEVSLALAQTTHDWLEALASGGSVALERACGNSGSNQRIALVDTDGNQRPGPGDRVEVTLSDCYVRNLDDNFSGTLTLVLTSPGAANGRWAGRVQFGPQFGIGLGTTGAIRLGGSMAFESQVDRLSLTVLASSTSEALVVETGSGATLLREVVTQVNSRKQVRRDTARATSTVALHLASDILQGAVVVSTEVPFSALLGIFPDAGSLAVTGAGTSRLRLQATNANSRLLAFSLDGIAIGTHDVPSTFDGFLFSGTGILEPNPIFSGLQIQTTSDQPYRILSAPDTGRTVSPTAPLVWQLSRPALAPTNATARFRALGFSETGLEFIDATFTVEGAMVTLTPTVQLEPGMSYVLEVNGSDGLAAAAADGSGVLGLRASFTTPTTLNVTASASSPLAIGTQPLLYGPSATATLQASVSTATGLSVASVRWQQLSGPAVNLAQADTMVTTATAGVPGQGNGEAEFEVQVRASNGDVDRARVKLLVVADASSTIVRGYRTGPTQPWRISQSAPPQPGDIAYSVKLFSTQLIDIVLGPRVFLLPPAPLAWSQAFVWNISRSAGSSSSSAIQLEDGTPDTFTCDATSGQVSTPDFATDPSGQLLRLALDYTLNCATGGQVQGWVRMQSTVPPP